MEVLLFILLLLLVESRLRSSRKISSPSAINCARKSSSSSASCFGGCLTMGDGCLVVSCLITLFDATIGMLPSSFALPTLLRLVDVSSLLLVDNRSIKSFFRPETINPLAFNRAFNSTTVNSFKSWPSFAA